MLSLEGRQDLAQLALMFGERTSVFVSLEQLEQWTFAFLRSLNNSIARAWVSEREMKHGVRYGLTKAGRRELDAYQRMLRGEASGL